MVYRSSVLGAFLSALLEFIGGRRDVSHENGLEVFFLADFYIEISHGSVRPSACLICLSNVCMRDDISRDRDIPKGVKFDTKMLPGLSVCLFYPYTIRVVLESRKDLFSRAIAAVAL